MGAGVKTLADSCRPMESLIPPQAKWMKAAVSEFHPDKNYVVTADGTKVSYEYLIVAMGLQVNFDKVQNIPFTEFLSENYIISLCVRVQDQRSS